MGELLIGVGERVVNEWERGFGLGELGLALVRSQGRIPPIMHLLPIGAEKVEVKLFFVYSRWYFEFGLEFANSFFFERTLRISLLFWLSHEHYFINYWLIFNHKWSQ